MIRSLSELEGDKLIATDGEFGHCSDFLFDDAHWTVRYMVADTGGWLPGRRVLISPAFLEPPLAENHGFPIRLSKHQIEESPPLDSDAPISRRYERAYNDFFMTPYYWMGNGLWGNYADPALMAQLTETPEPPLQPVELPPDNSEAIHLRSVREVSGYRILARDGEKTGRVADFIVDDHNWALRFLILDTSLLPFSKKILIAVDWIQDITWVERELRLDVTAQQIENAPVFDPNTPVNESRETILYDYYGRPRGKAKD